MIGLVVVGYDVLPEAMLVALQCITGKQDNICAVPLSVDEDENKQRQAILDAVSHVETGHGVLVFVDSMAAPAGFLMISIMDKAHIEVMGGVNLPMLSKVVEKREHLPLEELAELARDEGRKAIVWRRP